jgi:hypothetical protein
MTTRAQIIALRNEAKQAGDYRTADLCGQALAGDEDSVRECERVIASARPTFAVDDEFGNEIARGLPTYDAAIQQARAYLSAHDDAPCVRVYEDAAGGESWDLARAGYTIEGWDSDARRWSREQAGDDSANRFESRTEAEQALAGMLDLGGDYTAETLRVVAVTRVVGGPWMWVLDQR